MTRFLTVLLACACVVAPTYAIASSVPSQLQAQPNHPRPRVSNLVVRRSGPGQATLTWGMSATSGFRIKSVTVHRTGGANPKNATLGAVLRWTDQNVVTGTPYRYSVCAEDSTGATGCGFANFTLGGTPGP
jgi:hypothetical protein